MVSIMVSIMPAQALSLPAGPSLTKDRAAKLGWYVARLDERSLAQVANSIGVRLMNEPEKQRDFISRVSRRPKS